MERAVVSVAREWLTSAGRWARRHRRTLSAIGGMALALALLFEVGVRLVQPDAVEVIQYSAPGEPASFDMTYHDAALARRDYRALTSTPGAFIAPFTPAFAGCGHGPLDVQAAYHLQVRFLWRGLPLAVAAHDGDQPLGVSALFLCGQQMDWLLSSGGIVNPRPFIDERLITPLP